MTSYFPVCCCNFKDFLKRIEDWDLLRPKPNESQWVFKGVKDAQWPLKTTLERAFEQFGVPDNEKIKIERAMIREFQRRYHHYTANVPDKGELDEWMALMQHHGAPTRLLDFTYSPYVAAYFAFECACPGSNVAIWAVNTIWCKKRLESHIPFLAPYYWSYQKHRSKEAFKKIFFDGRPPEKLVLGVTPYRLNERLTHQKGTFLCPGDPTVSFIQNLFEFTGNDILVIKFTIPTGECGEIRNEALLSLEYMNINRITLFPGLDGFAQSFKPRIPWFRSIKWGQLPA